MSNAKKEALMKANKEKADKLDQLGILHDLLLGLSANNAALRDQGTDFDRLLTLEEIKQQNDEVVMLREKVLNYQETEKKWDEEWRRKRQEIAELQKKITGHKLTDDPAQVICRLKADHDKEFVARAGQISRWWKWGCISSLAALICTLIMWLVISLVSNSSTTTATPTADSLDTRSFNLDLDLPPIPPLE